MIQNHFLQNLTKETKVKKVNLFFIKNNEIAVFRLKNIDESEKKLELLKNQGENFQTINSDFWTWWEDKVGFLKDDETDFCFVWDKKHDVIMQNEKFCDILESDNWNEESLIGLLEFCQIKGKITSSDGNSTGFKNFESEFFTNLNIGRVEDKSQSNNSSSLCLFQSGNKQFSQGIAKTYTEDETKMQKYFREMREREEKQRRG